MNRTQDYLRDILERIHRIEAVVAKGQADFLQDVQSQAAVERHFEIIGEIVKRLPQSLLDQQLHISWKDIAGFRDILSHHYDRVDSETVWNTTQIDVPPLKIAISAMLETLVNPDE